MGPKSTGSSVDSSGSLYIRKMHPSPIDVNRFDDIRPYYDEEIRPAIDRILKEPVFMKMIRWIYPGLGKKAVQQFMADIRTVDDFQHQVSGPAFKVIMQTTTGGLSFTNLESVRKDMPYLFLSNHRDIILDSALLNVSLMENGYDTTEIAIGDNLLKTMVVRDLVRLNKNFIVNRDVSARDLFFYSLRLSNYIRATIGRGSSIWIAQREGRSKDGDDRTATGLLKMFTMSSGGPIEDALESLNILPVAVSYEYDPCDMMKAWELLHIRLQGSYAKEPGEDFRSMMRGLTGHKGRVNISVGSAPDDAFAQMQFIQNKNEKFKFLTEAIDMEMHKAYHLWPTNYMAYDLAHGTRDYKDHYSNIQKIAFGNYIRGHVIRLTQLRKKSTLPKEGFTKSAREILLQMYANPVLNKRSVEQPVR